MSNDTYFTAIYSLLLFCVCPIVVYVLSPNGAFVVFGIVVGTIKGNALRAKFSIEDAIGMAYRKKGSLGLYLVGLL